MTTPEPPKPTTIPDDEPGNDTSTWRAVVRKAAPVLLSGVVIYVLAPVLIKVFGAWPRLSSLRPAWAAVGVLAEVASFACTFMLKRIALRTRAVFPVVTSGLVGNAVTNVFPGADATGATVELRMLSSAGVETSDAVSGLTATALLQTGSLLALPLLALPAILAGLPVSRGLLHLAFLGLGMFALYVAAAFVMFQADWPLQLVGRLVQGAHNRVLRHRRPVSGLPERLVAQRNETRAALAAKWWEALLYAVGRVGFDFLCLLAMLVATRTRPEPWLVLIAYAATAVLALLPVTPGGLGLVEGSLTGLLVLAAVPASKAVLSTLAYRLASYWLPTLSGPLAYALFRRRYHQAPQRDLLTPTGAKATSEQIGPLALAESEPIRTIRDAGPMSRRPQPRRPTMAKEKDLAVFVAVYGDVESAKADLDAIEQMHKHDLIGTFDAAVVTTENGKLHVAKRMDRPMVRVIPEVLGFGPLSRKELKEVSTELTSDEAGLIMVGEPTLEKAFDKAVTHAAKTLKHVVDATADELADELKDDFKG